MLGHLVVSCSKARSPSFFPPTPVLCDANHSPSPRNPPTTEYVRGLSLEIQRSDVDISFEKIVWGETSIVRRDGPESPSSVFQRVILV